MCRTEEDTVNSVMTVFSPRVCGVEPFPKCCTEVGDVLLFIMLDSFCKRSSLHRSSLSIQVIELCMWGFGCHWAGRATGTTALMARSTGGEEAGAKEPARERRGWKPWPTVTPWGEMGGGLEGGQRGVTFWGETG